MRKVTVQLSLHATIVLDENELADVDVRGDRPIEALSDDELKTVVLADVGSTNESELTTRVTDWVGLEVHSVVVTNEP